MTWASSGRGLPADMDNRLQSLPEALKGEGLSQQSCAQPASCSALRCLGSWCDHPIPLLCPHWRACKATIGT